jgi:hypothetical protein
MVIRRHPSSRRREVLAYGERARSLEKVMARRAVALLSRACPRSETAADHAAQVASPRSLPSSKGAVRVLNGAEPPLVGGFDDGGHGIVQVASQERLRL